MHLPLTASPLPSFLSLENLSPSLSLSVKCVSVSGAGGTTYRQIFKFPFQSLLCQIACIPCHSKEVFWKKLSMKYLKYLWKSRSGLLKIPGNTGLPIFCCESHCPGQRTCEQQVFLRPLLCSSVFLSLHVWKLLHVGNKVTRSRYEGDAWCWCTVSSYPMPGIDLTSDYAHSCAVLLIWAGVILGFIEVVVNSNNLEFNILVLPPPQWPESWDYFCLKVWVTAECSVPMSLQLELLGMAQGSVMSQWQGHGSLLSGDLVLHTSHAYGSLQGSSF